VNGPGRRLPPRKALIAATLVGGLAVPLMPTALGADVPSPRLGVDYTCVPAPTDVVPPPPLLGPPGTGLLPTTSTLPPLCPAGQVPQSLAPPYDGPPPAVAPEGLPGPAQPEAQPSTEGPETTVTVPTPTNAAPILPAPTFPDRARLSCTRLAGGRVPACVLELAARFARREGDPRPRVRQYVLTRGDRIGVLGSRTPQARQLIYVVKLNGRFTAGIGSTDRPVPAIVFMVARRSGRVVAVDGYGLPGGLARLGEVARF